MRAGLIHSVFRPSSCISCLLLGEPRLSCATDTQRLIFQNALMIVGIVVMVGALIPWVFIPMVPLVIVFFLLRRYFLRTSRDIKRLEGTSEFRVCCILLR